MQSSKIKRVSMNPSLAQKLTSSFERQSTSPEARLLKINRVIRRVNLHGLPSLIQYWECNPVSGSHDNGFNLTVNGQLSLLTNHNYALEHYRDSYLGHHFVGQTTKLNKWLAGRAVQTRVADQGTKRIDHTDLGILVLPVFVQQGTCKQIVGIIELVTIEPKRSYEKDLVHIHELLREEGLISEGIGKMIKVHCDDNIIKFPLSCSAKLKDLQKEVRKRLPTKLEGKTFSIKYEDTNRKRYQISSDENLKVCIKESVSKETTLIRMFVEPKA